MIRLGAKMSTIIKNALLNAIERLNSYYAPVIQAWAEMTDAQKQAYFEHSPILSAIVNFANQFEVK
jgi:hypothetical protein